MVKFNTGLSRRDLRAHPLIKFLIAGTVIKREAKLLDPVLIRSDSFFAFQLFLQLLVLSPEPS